MKLLTLGIALGVLLAGGLTLNAWVQRSVLPPPPPGSPVAARALLYAQPFTLQQSYAFEWRAEHPTVEAGWLLVIQTDPALCTPSDEYEPVLYVGGQTVERINTGRDSGRIVAVLPAPRGASGEPDFDLAKAEIFWGSPRLPEQVDERIVQTELATARSAGIAPFSATQVSAARAKAGPPLAFVERDELTRHAAHLIQAFATPEAELAEGMLVPRVR
jgi:hypothetical protein